MYIPPLGKVQPRTTSCAWCAKSKRATMEHVPNMLDNTHDIAKYGKRNVLSNRPYFWWTSFMLWNWNIPGNVPKTLCSTSCLSEQSAWYDNYVWISAPDMYLFTVWWWGGIIWYITKSWWSYQNWPLEDVYTCRVSTRTPNPCNVHIYNLYEW